MRSICTLSILLLMLLSGCEDKLVLEPKVIVPPVLPSSTFTSSGSAIIPDQSTGSSAVSVSGLGGTVGGRIQKVTIDLTHTYDSDLDIFLYAPNGSMIELSSDNGGSGDNYYNTVFESGASTSITSGTAPFTGTFAPEQSFSGLSSSAIDGVWYLVVYDDTSGDSGVINSWSITLTL